MKNIIIHTDESINITTQEKCKYPVELRKFEAREPGSALKLMEKLVLNIKIHRPIRADLEFIKRIEHLLKRKIQFQQISIQGHSLSDITDEASIKSILKQQTQITSFTYDSWHKLFNPSNPNDAAILRLIRESKTLSKVNLKISLKVDAAAELARSFQINKSEAKLCLTAYVFDDEILMYLTTMLCLRALNIVSKPQKPFDDQTLTNINNLQLDTLQVCVNCFTFSVFPNVTNLILDFQNMENSVVLDALKVSLQESSRMVRLKLMGNIVLNSSFRVLSGNLTLQELEIAVRSLDAETHKSLFEAMAANNHIEILTVDYMDQDLSLGSNYALKNLSIRDVSCATVMQSIINAVVGTQVVSLALPFGKFNVDLKPVLASNIRELKSTQALTLFLDLDSIAVLGSNRIETLDFMCTTNDWLELASALNSNQNLRRFHVLIPAELSDPALAAVLNAMRSHSGIKSLLIAVPNLEIQLRIADIIRDAPNLEYVTIVLMYDGPLELALFQALKSNNHIVDMHCAINASQAPTPEFMDQIYEMICDNKVLCELHLHDMTTRGRELPLNPKLERHFVALNLKSTE